VRVENTAGWSQERWYAAYQVALLLERTGAAPAEVTEAHLTAYAIDPSRAETLVELSRIEREQGRFAPALLFAREALQLPFPEPSALFVDVDAYACRRFDEYAVSAYQLGRFASGYDAAKRASTARPDDRRLAENVAWFERALATGR
jgi:tetratricopeptide (TPR) repeat protein